MFIRRIKFLLFTLFVTIVITSLNSVSVADNNVSSPLILVPPAIAYHPRKFNPIPKSSTLSLKDLREDLQLLQAAGFRSIVTYSSAGILGEIPKIAREENFDGTVIMGIWDPFSNEELQNALKQVNNVDGYCIGNEGLGVRYKPGELLEKMNNLRNLTNHPVTTSEPIDSYLSGTNNKWLINHSDWLFPIAHPFWASKFSPQQAIEWILVRYDYLATSSGKQVILKEAGFPTQGTQDVNDSSQLEFFRLLDRTDLSFYHFEAFDQPWKKYEQKYQEVEAHWGLYTINRNAKKIIPWLKTRWKK